MVTPSAGARSWSTTALAFFKVNPASVHWRRVSPSLATSWWAPPRRAGSARRDNSPRPRRSSSRPAAAIGACAVGQHGVQAGRQRAGGQIAAPIGGALGPGGPGASPSTGRIFTSRANCRPVDSALTASAATSCELRYGHLGAWARRTGGRNRLRRSRPAPFARDAGHVGGHRPGIAAGIGEVRAVGALEQRRLAVQHVFQRRQALQRHAAPGHRAGLDQLGILRGDGGLHLPGHDAARIGPEGQPLIAVGLTSGPKRRNSMPDQARASPVCASFTRVAPAASGRARTRRPARRPSVRRPAPSWPSRVGRSRAPGARPGRRAARPRSRPAPASRGVAAHRARAKDRGNARGTVRNVAPVNDASRGRTARSRRGGRR